MVLILRHKVLWIATVWVLVLSLEKGASQSLYCPNGITNIKAATGQIAHPGSSINYGVNETKCWKIQVPDVYEGIGIYYHVLDIEQCDDCGCDSLTFAFNDSFYSPRAPWSNDSFYSPRAPWREYKECGRLTSGYLEFAHMMDGDPNKKISAKELYVRFSSDDSVNYKGFNFTFVAKTDSSKSKSYLNASKDETIEFGTSKFGIKNYPADYEEQWYLIVPAARQIQITFDAFELEQSENCTNAYVEIREAYHDDGPFQNDIEAEYGAFLAEHLCGSNLPKPIRSVGNMAWVMFKSAKDASTAYKGFKASFKAVGQTTVGQCCDCKCNQSGQGGLSSNILLLFVSALVMITKNSLF